MHVSALSAIIAYIVDFDASSPTEYLRIFTRLNMMSCLPSSKMLVAQRFTLSARSLQQCFSNLMFQFASLSLHSPFVS